MSFIPTIITEPSIGQIEYLKHLQRAGHDATPDYVTISIEMDELYIEAVEKTISFFVKRHESLRTVFPMMDDEVKQVVLAYDDHKFAVEYIDVSTSGRFFAEVKEECFKRAGRTFSDIQNGPLVKFFVFKQAANVYQFYLLIHHIICDGWSIELIGRELRLFYQFYASGKEPDILPLRAQLRDYCQKQNQWLRGNRDELERFWKNRVSGFDRLFDINNFYEGYLLRGNKRLLQTEVNGEAMSVNDLLRIYRHPEALACNSIISDERFINIKKLAGANNCTISSIVYASLYIFLFCYTGKKKILLAALIADRFTEEDQLLIGCLLGGVYFPREIAAHDTISDFISQTFRDVFANCRNILPSHEYLNLDAVKLHVSSDIYINYQQEKDRLAPTTQEGGAYLEIPGIFYPLDFMITEYIDGLFFKWKYNKLLFSKELIDDMIKCHEDVLDFMAFNGDKTIGEACEYIKMADRSLSEL
jgi:hypothetical protein